MSVDNIGVPGDGPGRCEHTGCTERGDNDGRCLPHAIQHDVMLALDEQVSEALGHMNEPSYSTYDCQQNAAWFGTVRDWLSDNWDEITVDRRG